MENLALVDVVCPKCAEKARYRAEWNNSYKRNPKNDGFLTCTHCGLAKDYNLNKLKYFYAVEIKERHLVARDKDAFIILYNYFTERMNIEDDPDMDFPKVFYVNRDELLHKMKSLIESESN